MSKKLTRREVITALAGAAAVASIPAWVSTGGLPTTQEANPAPEHPGHKRVRRQWAMVIDLRKCEGCVTIDKPPQCTASCEEMHALNEGQTWMRVFEQPLPGGHHYFMPRPCMQCENAPCLNVCPVSATYRDETGNVLVNQERCIGCRLCMAACPYGARYFNWGDPKKPANVSAVRSPDYPVPQRRGTVGKCTFCAHQTENGELPGCCQGCPMKAIYFGDLLADVASNGAETVQLSRFLDEHAAYRYKEELGTRPRVWYIPGHGQDSGHKLS